MRQPSLYTRVVERFAVTLLLGESLMPRFLFWPYRVAHMNSAAEKLARRVVWLMLLGGMALMIYGAYGLSTEGYNLRGLWITGGGLVFALASYPALAERRRR